MNAKKTRTGIAAFFGMVILILDAPTALLGAQEGVELCIRTVIPSLFPFLVLSILMNGSLAGSSASLLRPIGRLFGVPAGMEALLISAFLGGYPVGAQAVAEAYRTGSINKEEAQHLLGFCNNPGPAFLFGMVSASFSDGWTVWTVWTVIFLSAWMVSKASSCQAASASLPAGKSIGLPAAMNSAIRVMAAVCGWVVLFRVILSFLDRWVLWIFPDLFRAAIAGIMELTNGCCLLPQIPDERQRFVLCCTILTFGGLCVTMQTASVLSGLSLGRYLQDKLLQTMLSLLLSLFLAYRSIPCLLLIGIFFLPKSIKKQKSSRIIRKAIV